MSDRMDQWAKSMASGGISRRRAFGAALAALFGVGAVSTLSSSGTAPCETYCRQYKGLQRAACLLNCKLQSNNTSF
jgi:hypothetical protein